MQRQVTSKADARSLMDEIIDITEKGLSAFEQAFVLAREFETGALYKQLGYRSMAACWAAEMGQTRRRWYQLRDQFAASEMLSEAAGEPVQATSRVAAVVKREPESVKRFHTSVEAGTPIIEAIQQEIPVSRARFDDGYGASASEFDAGEAVYRVSCHVRFDVAVTE